MKKIINLILTLFIILSVGINVIGCSKEEDSINTIVDMAGTTITLPMQIDNVICVSQNAMEFMVAMGLGDKLIGVHKSIFDHTWSPEYITNLNSLSGYGYSPAAEAVYSSGADLVIVKEASAAEKLRQAGITAITFQYSNVEEMFQAVRMLGEIFGRDTKSYAERWIADYKNVAKEIEAKVSTLTEEQKINAYFINASVALDAGGLTSTVGGDNIVSDWFNTIGVNLVTEDYHDISSINEERILEINPEAIIIGGWSENTRKEQLLSDEKWTDINAVKNGKIYLTPVGFVSFERYAVEAPILLRYSASLVYPDLFEYNAIEDFKQFFKDYYGLEVSEEKIGYMLKGLSPDGSRMD